MTIGIGIVGGGFWARLIHVPTLQRIAGYEVVGVASRRPEAGSEFATEFGLPRRFETYQQLVSDPDVDIVDILVPNDLHKEVALAAFAAGKDVIIIKPLARTLEEAREIVETAERLGRTIYYAENVPFIPAVRELKSLIDAGEYGKVFRIKALHGTPGPHAAWFSDPARSGGGSIMDMAVHGISFLQSMMDGATPVAISATAGTFLHDYPVEDTSVMLIRYDNGVLAQTEDSWSIAAGFDSRYEVFGTKGHAFADLLFGHPIRSIVGGAEGGANAVQFKAIDPHIVKDGHVAMFEHFLEVHTSGVPSRSTGIDGLRVMEIVEAAYRSVRSGQYEPIRLSR